MEEKIYYNAINIALNGDYGKIKSLKERAWKETWLKIQKDFTQIDPEKEFAKLQNNEIRLVLKEEASFPECLKEMPWPPFALYIQGTIHPLQSIAIVGTRKVTTSGKTLAKKISSDLSDNNIQIISGLAMGVDEAAHTGAVERSGKTIAVLPSGLNNIYPRQNLELSKKIIDSEGALISEFHLDFKPYTSSFIQRNRIISALSLATIIIEAPEKSGALATARFAIEQNRELLVTPGPASHPNYKGSHKLLREGAGLVTCAEEILEDLGIENIKNKEQENPQNTEKLTEEEIIILTAIKQLGWPGSVDKISEMTKIQVQKVNQIIAFLIIKGILK